MTTAAVTDGRSARSQRTRLAVVDALLDLLRDGNPRPTAREIASRAGVSLRSVYVHFDDLDDLYLAAAKRHLMLVSDLYVEVPATGPVHERAASWVGMHGQIYEQHGAVHRAAALQAPFSPTLAKMLDRARKRARAEVRRIFKAELDPLAADQRARKLALVTMLGSPETWSRMRAEGLDVAATQAAVTEAIIATLQSGGTAAP